MSSADSPEIIHLTKGCDITVSTNLNVGFLHFRKGHTAMAKMFIICAQASFKKHLASHSFLIHKIKLLWNAAEESELVLVV